MKVIFINSHIRGAVSNEETIWSILSENLADAKGIALNTFKGDISQFLNEEKPDVVVINSILRGIAVPNGTKIVAFLQDNFVAMQKFPLTFRSFVKTILTFGRETYGAKAKIQKRALEKADMTVAVSKSVANSYGCAVARIIPVGTNPSLFRLLPNKDELKAKYGIPTDRKIKIFVGSTHLVKGFDILMKEIKNDKDSFYILVLKDNGFLGENSLPNAKVFKKIDQKQLCELHNCADVFVGRSRVETLWLAPIEAMFCGVPIDITRVGIFEDWMPMNIDPRKEAFEKELDQETMIKRWRELIEEMGRT